MRFFVCFSAAMAWGFAVFGAAAWVIWQINPDRPDLGLADMVSVVGVLALAMVAFVGGIVVAEKCSWG